MRENHQSIVPKYHKIDPKEYQQLLTIEIDKIKSIINLMNY